MSRQTTAADRAADPPSGQWFHPPQVLPANILAPLDATLSWFRNHPPGPGGANFNDRWRHTDILDYYGSQLRARTWREYRRDWTRDPAAADGMERSYPILYYLRKADLTAFREIKTTVVKRGFVMWYLYNMGYVVKTKDKCFGIDMVARGSESLVPFLDFAICSHRHTDHFDVHFLDAMVAAGKPVFSPFYAKGTRVLSTNEYTFGEVHVRLTLSHEQPDVPVLLSQINLGAGAGNYTIYDVADARPMADLNPTRHINLLILHIQNKLNVFDAVARVKPDVTLYAHEMELGHEVGHYRWSYRYAYRKIQSQPHASSDVLTWGEKLDKSNEAAVRRR